MQVFFGIKKFKFPLIFYWIGQYSLLGDLGYTYKGLGLGKFLEDWKIEQKTITAGFLKEKKQQPRKNNWIFFKLRET